MKKLLLTTLTFLIVTSLLVSCNKQIEGNKQSNSEFTQEQTKYDSKQANQNTNKENTRKSTDVKTSNTNSATKKNSLSEDLKLIRINIISSDTDWCKYSFESLGTYSSNKLNNTPKDISIGGFIVGNNPLENSVINSDFEYNELIAPFGHIKYPNFLKLEKNIVPVSGAGFRFKDCDNQIEFDFTCHEPFSNIDGTGNQTVDDAYKIMTDSSIDPESKITYKAKGKDWVCVSSEKNDIISYNFVKLGKDLRRSFSYSYPKKYEKQFNSIIEESYKTFKTDNLIN